MSSSAPISVGILEDNPDFREFVTGLVATTARLRLAFAAEDVASGLAAFASTRPDVLLVDLQLPDGSGLELVRAAQPSATRMLMLTVLADRDSVLGALEAGAHGYLLKDTGEAGILRAIETVFAGETPISPSAAGHLLNLLRAPAGPASARPTRREQEIVQMIARGLTYAEIAAALGLSVHTVGDHIKSIYRKLEVGSKSEAVFEARTQRWIGYRD